MENADALNVLQAAAFFVLLFTATATDVTRRRIPNALILAGMGCGLVFGGVSGWIAGEGVQGLTRSLGGGATAFALFFVLHWLGGLGAGDVKLMGAVGFLTNWQFVLWATICTAFAGAVLAILWLIIHGGWREALGRSVSTTREDRREMVREPDHARTLPYAIAICTGCIWALLETYRRTGALPWS